MEGPPTKIAAVGYRYCPHCGQTVSKRTYRKHVSLPVFDFHLPVSDFASAQPTISSGHDYSLSGEWSGLIHCIATLELSVATLLA